MNVSILKLLVVVALVAGLAGCGHSDTYNPAAETARTPVAAEKMPVGSEKPASAAIGNLASNAASN